MTAGGCAYIVYSIALLRMNKKLDKDRFYFQYIFLYVTWFGLWSVQFGKLDLCFSQNESLMYMSTKQEVKFGLTSRTASSLIFLTNSNII